MAQRYLITGANRGIGLELARQLAVRGDDVIATCRTPSVADELQALPVRVLPLDVTAPASVEALSAAIPAPLDVLINNAGVGVGGGPLGQVDHEEVLRFVDVNALGSLRVAEALLPQLRRGQRRVVANMTSRMGSIGDNTSGGSYAYRASKAALNMITKSMAVDLAGEGFTCVVLHPGWVRTAMGGRNAPLDAATSVAGLLRVIDGLRPEDNARFFDYEGQALPW